MAKLFKLPLISFIACALTIGGIFGAWTFGGGGSADIDSNLTAGTTPTNYWYFDSVTFKFSANSRASSSEDGYIEGTFATSGLSYVSVDVHQGGGINQNAYENIILENGKPTSSNDVSYVFSHWAYYKTGEETPTHFNFDVGLDISTTLYAQYVPVTNPAIYLSTDSGHTNPLAYLFLNPNIEAGEPVEYMANNFHVALPHNERGGHYVIRYNDVDYHCKWDDGKDGVDAVYKGTYTVYFRPGGNLESENWENYGGYTYFQRQYKFSLMGNPATGWAFADNENAITLGWDSETINNSTNKKTTIYSADKVYFTNEIWTGSEANYEFKPYESYFDLWPGTPSSESNFKIQTLSTTTVSGNNLAPLNSKPCLYTVTATVVYSELQSFSGLRIYNYYPETITITLTPCQYSIKYYQEDKKSLIGSEMVNYGDLPLNYKEIGYNSVDLGNNNYKFVTEWVDIYTGESLDVEDLISGDKVITKNYNVYPVYGDTQSPSKTINFYNQFNSGWSSTLPPVYLYDCPYSTHNSYTLDSLSATAPSEYDSFANYWQKDTVSASGTKYTTNSIKQGNIDSFLGSGEIINYYAEFTKTTPQVKINTTTYTPSNTARSIIYQNITNSSHKYYNLETTKTIDHTGVEIDITPANSGTNIGTTGTVGFHVVGGKVVGSPKSVITTGYDSTKLYLKPNDWLSANARFAAYFFGNGETWVNMTSAGNGVYQVTKPTNKIYPSVIFCRMNPSTTANNFNNGVKWNQTGDLTIPTNANLFTINTSNSWDGQTTGWSIQSETNKYTISDGLISSIYLEPDSNWLSNSAWFAAYFYKSTNSEFTWRQMLDYNSDDIYECGIPSGFDKVIFVRMNSSNKILDFTFKWNQTGDLIIPTNGNNLFTIDAWDGQTDGWSNLS